MHVGIKVTGLGHWDYLTGLGHVCVACETTLKKMNEYPLDPQKMTMYPKQR